MTGMYEEIFKILTKIWMDRGCHEALAQENAAIEMMWIWQAAQVAAVLRRAQQDCTR